MGFLVFECFNRQLTHFRVGVNMVRKIAIGELIIIKGSYFLRKIQFDFRYKFIDSYILYFVMKLESIGV